MFKALLTLRTVAVAFGLGKLFRRQRKQGIPLVGPTDGNVEQLTPPPGEPFCEPYCRVSARIVDGNRRLPPVTCPHGYFAVSARAN
jgi:hypothetical protein